MDKEIIIEYKPNIDTLMDASKYILFRLRFVKYIIIVFFIILLQSVTQISGGFPEAKEQSLFSNLLPIIMMMAIWSILYFATIFQTKKSILKNKKNLEHQKITFNKTSFIQEAVSFKMDNYWSEIYKVKETKNWFLIYLAKNSALPIIKADLKDNQYNELKELFNSIDIKKSLKN